MMGQTDPIATEPIAVVTTGGTLDKVYFDALSTYQVGESVVARLLAVAAVTHPVEIVEFSRKDSLDMTDEDRARLRERIAGMAARKIVVTHGTDTMTETAAALVGLGDKTIVLTGALSPARFSESDAPFNLGMAFGVVQTSPPGVYIVMNGTVFAGNSVRKDRMLGRFVRVTG